MNRILSVYIEKNGKQEYVGKIVGDSSVDACFSYDDSYIEKDRKSTRLDLAMSVLVQFRSLMKIVRK